MVSGLDKYQKELDQLIYTGDLLTIDMQRACYPEDFDEQIKIVYKTKVKIDEYLSKLPKFKSEYQIWYSEAMSVVKKIIPDRLNDFVGYYEKPKNRKDISHGNYVICDYLQGLRVTHYGEVKVDSSAAICQFDQQLGVLKSARKRFESSLFDIERLVQADLFDSEIEAARELLKNKFLRAAGAVAGVVLEKHLRQVCKDHGVTIRKKHPSISDLNDLLKKDDVIEVAQWRYIQHLGDIRNLCDHNKEQDPKSEQVTDLIDGVAKVSKTVI